MLISCKEKFNPNEFKGTWFILDKDQSISNLPYITFRNDSVFFEDMFTYTTLGKFKITRSKIFYYFKKDTLNYEFNFSSKDSTITIDSNEYFFLDGFSYDSKFIDYQLANIYTKNIISSDSLSKYNCGFHLFKDSKDSLKLKLNDKETNDFELIPRFAFQRHKPNEVVVIYIGEKIKLKDILKCYVKLSTVNIKKAFLLTGHNFKENNYNGFLDDFEIWRSQINLFLKEKIEPVYSDELSRKKYIQNYNPKIIIINSKNDFEKLSDIKTITNYLIQINSEMSIEEYISLKEKVFQIKIKYPKKIRTEFINLQ
ncbi:hypothetical protein BW723_11185 [Polaribacter reichenbachii]|uniref:Uncharacterized protein n=2 Tax=Polaribacter reichenbachii TaxID=996801 RepID=A0A1B8TPT8_9FLAO|nr:hypothetical protein BW723_11185 [Polaribacter reichenbachii]AUC17455.1 hypothetical protein BTO17_01630 [Polaribacter reichenbachii]OBY61670.1 hypothetical protein LPB301_16580 [Polaribacter reichenbachii]